MLTAITLTLAADHDVTLPQNVGRANYAAVLARLSQVDPTLAAELHDSDGPKPITCSDLLGARRNRSGTILRAGQTADLRFTGLSERVSMALHACLLEAVPETWTLLGQRLPVVRACCQAEIDPRTGSTDYEALASQQLLGEGAPARRAVLQFDSPTAFKSHGNTVPIPLPGLVFGSLVERWNVFSPVTLSPEMRDYAQEAVVISRYNLRSLPVVQKNAGLRVGGVGEVTYHALGGDRYWFGVLQMLADFAKYSGVGVQTATGMGQCRRI